MPDMAPDFAEQADRQGNLYTGPNTEDTPTIVEAAGFPRWRGCRAGQRDRG